MIRRRALPLTLILLALLAPAAPLAAQEPASAPTQDDPASLLYRAALELESAGELDLADSLLDYILGRYPDSDAAAAIRRVRAEPGSRRIDSSGRTELVVWSTLYGLWLGVAIPGMLGADDPEPYGVGLLLGGPLGFLTGRGYTRSTPVGDGAAEAITWGGTWGSWQGFGWAQVLDLGSDCDDSFGPRYCDDEPSAEAVFGSMVALGLAGTATGYLASRNATIDPGDASAASLGSLWGTWYGVALGVLADAEDDALLTSALLGGNVGLLGGVVLARTRDISRSRARMVSIVGVAAGLAGAGLDLLIQPDDEKVAIGIPAATSALGLVLAAGLGGEDEPRRTGSRPAAPGQWDWELGGPVIPTSVDGAGGERRAAVDVTLLSARF